MNTRLLTILALCLLSLALQRGESIALAESEDWPSIGMLVPLTGPYAPGGVDVRQGFEAGRAAASSPIPLQFIFADSKAEPTTGVSEFRKFLISDKTIGVFVQRGSVGMAINPISRSNKVPLLGGVGNKDFAAMNEYALQFWSKSDDEGAFLAGIFKKRGFSSAAIFTVQDDWQGSVSAAFRSAYEKTGGAILSDVDLLASEVDFRTTLLQLKSKKPAAIFANLSLAQIGPFLKQAKELEVSTPIFSNFWTARKEVMEFAGAAAVEGVHYVEIDTDRPSLVKFVAEKYNSRPAGPTLSAYAAVLLLAQVMKENPQIHTREELAKSLLRQTRVETPDGPIPIVDRVVMFPLVEKQMKDGKVEVLREVTNEQK